MKNQEVAQQEAKSNKIDHGNVFLNKIFLEILNSKNENFKNRFQAMAPDIYADIESYYANNNCSCRSKIEGYIISNREKSAEFLNNFITENGGENHSLFNIADVEAKYNVFTPPGEAGKQISPQDKKDIINYAGKTELVKISEWENYVAGLREKHIRFFQFSTVKVDDETIRVFFL